MNKSLKSVLVWSALLALAAVVLGLIVYTTWALVAFAICGVLLMGAQDYRLINHPRVQKVVVGK